MYLVSPDYLNTVTSKNIPPHPPQSPNTEKAGKNIIALSDYGL